MAAPRIVLSADRADCGAVASCRYAWSGCDRYFAGWSLVFLRVRFRKPDALHLEVCPRCAPVSQQHRVLREVFRFDRLQAREPAADGPGLASPAGVSERTAAPLVYGSAASAASSHRRP